MNKNTLRDSYVWWSSKESRDAGKVSVLAVAETIISVAGFWWLALAYSYELLLLTSVILAFFVLLRSPESVARGVEMLNTYQNSKGPTSKAQITIFALVSIACAGSVAWWLANHWLGSYEGWALFWRAACTGLIALNLGFAVAIAGTGAGALKIAIAILGVIWLIFVLPGWMLGVAFRAIVVRFWATLRHLHKGLPCFFSNWTMLAFSTDFCTPPELIPGLPDNHNLHFNHFFHAFRTNRAAGAQIIHTFLCIFPIVIFYLPSLFYRYYLKSTAWIYFPLIWIVRVPGQLRDANGGLLWDRAQRRSLVAWIGFALASITVLFFGWRYADPAAIQGAIETVSLNSGLPVHPLLMFAGFGFANIHGLHLLPPAAAVCSVAAFLWTNHIHTRVDRYPDQTPGQVQTRAILWLGNLTAMLAYAWIATGVFELAWASYEACQLPPFFQQGVGKVFAPAACGA